MWNEKSKMLKLSVPTAIEAAHLLGQVAYGVEALPTDGREAVSQKWQAVVSDKVGMALTCVNDGTYESDFVDGELPLSLLRSPGYSGHPIAEDSDDYVIRLFEPTGRSRSTNVVIPVLGIQHVVMLVAFEVKTY